MISLHNMLPFELTKDTPYLALSGELWSVFYEYFNRNWSCYKGFLLYYHCGCLNGRNSSVLVSASTHSLAVLDSSLWKLPTKIVIAALSLRQPPSFWHPSTVHWNRNFIILMRSPSLPVICHDDNFQCSQWWSSHVCFSVEVTNKVNVHPVCLMRIHLLLQILRD